MPENEDYDESRLVIIDYTNWAGVRGFRTILPIGMFWGYTKFHTGLQWLLEALDVVKKEKRTFAMCDIHSWSRP